MLFRYSCFNIAPLYLCICGFYWWWLKWWTRSTVCKIACWKKCQQYFPHDIQIILCFLFVFYFSQRNISTFEFWQMIIYFELNAMTIILNWYIYKFIYIYVVQTYEIPNDSNSMFQNEHWYHHEWKGLFGKNRKCFCKYFMTI